MPWVDDNRCTGCGVCVEECPVGAIVMEESKAEIKMENCIRCGVCHGVCVSEAVRHDSEKIPESVEMNIEMTKGFMEDCAKYLGGEEEKDKCLMRMMKHFNKEKVIAEKTLECLRGLKK